MTITYGMKKLRVFSSDMSDISKMKHMLAPSTPTMQISQVGILNGDGLTNSVGDRKASAQGFFEKVSDATYGDGTIMVAIKKLEAATGDIAQAVSVF